VLFDIHGKTLHILGYDEKWKGFTWKYKLMKEFIQNLSDDEILVFMDGYDVLFISNNNLETKFKSLTKHSFGIYTHKNLTK